MSNAPLVGDGLFLAHSSPLYERANGALRAYIDIKGYQPGDRLPAQSVLASELGISRSTLREALTELRHQRVIDSHHGVGTFVTNPHPPAISGGLEELKSLKNLSSQADADVVRADWLVERVDAPEHILGILDLPEVAPVVRVRSAAAIDGVRCATIDSFLSEEWVDVGKLAAYSGGSLLDYLMESNPPLVAYAKSEVSATTAEGAEAKWLLVDDGTPVLHLSETFHTAAGAPVIHSLNNFRTEIISFYIVRKVV